MTHHHSEIRPYASVAATAESIRSGHSTALEATRSCLDSIGNLDHEYGAFTTVLADRALERAKHADAEVTEGRALGPLHGVPVTVKDAFLMERTYTTIGSRMLLEYEPPNVGEATCVRKLRESGAVLLGKTNVAHASVNNGRCKIRLSRNPWNPAYSASGSSSGSAVAVALGMGYASIGTDLGGSIRIPAAWVGIVGLKPTHGLVSQYGDVYGLCRSYEHVGPLTRTVRDAALVLGAIAGHDPQDPTSTTTAWQLGPSTVGHLHIGWVANGGPVGAEEDIQARAEVTAKILAERGHTVSRISLPRSDLELWYQAVLAEEWEIYSARWEPTDIYQRYIANQMATMRQYLMLGLTSRVDSLRREYGRFFSEFDVLLLPTTPITAKPVGVDKMEWQGAEAEILDLDMANTWMFNLTGNPALSLPCGFDRNNLPIGIQLVGRHFREDMLLSLAAELEDELGGFRLPPPVVTQTETR